MTNACPLKKKTKKIQQTNKQTNKQTHVLPSYDRVLYKFNETPLLDKVPLRMSPLEWTLKQNTMIVILYEG